MHQVINEDYKKLIKSIPDLNEENTKDTSPANHNRRVENPAVHLLYIAYPYHVFKCVAWRRQQTGHMDELGRWAQDHSPVCEPLAEEGRQQT